MISATFTLLITALALIISESTDGATLSNLPANQVEYSPIVQLDSGKVRGVIRNGYDNQKVYFYQGIRFGRAERFNLPKPVEPWTEVYNATKVRYACPQPGKRPGKLSDDESLTSTSVSSEDCLFLNVWQPANQPKSGSNRTVMFWIYGGAFHTGTIFESMSDSTYLSTLGDVVVVAVNYRIGPFGFFNGGTKEEPGNLGLYDQILGLEWVQNNVHHFGGNPNDVTIFGESAGSFSVGALVLSPLTKGLFKRAILQSGAPNSYLGSEAREVSLLKTKKFADRFNCPYGEGKQQQLLACLRNLTVDQILDVSTDEIVNVEIFLPNYPSDWLPTTPVKALKEFDRSLDVMYGVVRNEGSGFVGPILAEFDSETSNITLTKTKSAIVLLMILFNLPNQDLILNHYTQHLTESSTKQQFRDAVSNVFGDYQLVCPTVLFGEHVAQGKQHQNHQFYSYRLMRPPTRGFSNCHPWMGVCHSEDLIYLFGHPLMDGSKSSEEDRKLSRDMIIAWSQFAKSGQIQPISGVKWSQAVDQSIADPVTRYFALDNKYQMVENYWNVTCNQLWKPIIFVE